MLKARCHYVPRVTILGSPFARLLSGVARPGDLPLPPSIKSVDTPEETVVARAWQTSFKEHSAIPLGLVETSFSRSSGPGGQNVNKVNTKATIRCSVDAAWIPQWARPQLTRTPFYVASSHTLMTTSTVWRSQSQNLNECLTKLHSLILSTASEAIKNETSPETKERVARHERAAQARRKTEKHFRSQVKAGRSKRGWDE